MVSRSPVLVLLGLLAGAVMVAGGGAAVVPGGGCELTALAAEVAASCAAGTATLPCCAPVVASVELGGGACLFHLASEMPVVHAGLSASALDGLYATCAGAGSATASLSACHGAPPSVGPVVPALRSTATGGHFASVVKVDRVWGTPESSSVSSLGGPLSPPPPVVDDVIQLATHSLAIDDKRLILSLAVAEVIALTLTLIVATVEVCRCINGRKHA